MKIRSIDRSYAVGTNPYICVACEAAVTLKWRLADEDKPTEVHHCPYCGANDALVRSQKKNHGRSAGDTYDIEPRPPR